MGSALFNVIVDGQVVPGFDHDTVLAQLQQQLKLSENKARQLLAGKVVTVKHDIPADIADAYCKRLLSLGLNAQRLATATVEETNTTAVAAMASCFDAIPVPLPAIDNRSSFQHALYRTIVRMIGIAASYAALTLFALVITLYYLIHFSYLLIAPPVLFSATVFLLPLMALLILSMLLLRPFMPVKSPIASALMIQRSEQPQLFSFVDQLCATLAVSPPDAIALSAQTTISISLLPGFKNLWRGDYQLTIGLPLLDACSIADFAGLLAGNLRTCATPVGLRYIALLQDIQQRSQGCITGTDWLCDRIGQLQQRWNQFPRLTTATSVLLAQSNRLLQKYLTRSATVDLQFQRDLLHEHDCYLVLIAGSSALPTVLLVQEKLAAAAKDAIAKNSEDRIDRGLVDDLPALIRHYYESIDEKYERETRRRWENETTPRRDCTDRTRTH